MAVIGILSILILFLCLSAVSITGRSRWLLVGIWCIPLIGMVCFSQENTEINGLVVLIAFIMMFITSSSMMGVKMWNIRRRNSVIVFHIFLFVLTCILAFYVIIQLWGYICNLEMTAVDLMDYYVIYPISIPVILISIPISTMMLTHIDRLFCKKDKLILIHCKTFIGNEIGGNWIFWKGYFVYGINNGVKYEFKVTTRTYLMIKNEKSLILNIKKGWLGGLYVTENPCPQNIEKVKRRDQRNFKLIVKLIVLGMIGIVAYFIYFKVILLWAIQTIVYLY